MKEKLIIHHHHSLYPASESEKLHLSPTVEWTLRVLCISKKLASHWVAIRYGYAFTHASHPPGSCTRHVYSEASSVLPLKGGYPSESFQTMERRSSLQQNCLQESSIILKCKDTSLECTFSGTSTWKRHHGWGGIFERLVKSMKHCLWEGKTDHG